MTPYSCPVFAGSPNPILARTHSFRKSTPNGNAEISWKREFPVRDQRAFNSLNFFITLVSGFFAGFDSVLDFRPVFLNVVFNSVGCLVFLRRIRKYIGNMWENMVGLHFHSLGPVTDTPITPAKTETSACKTNCATESVLLTRTRTTTGRIIKPAIPATTINEAISIN